MMAFTTRHSVLRRVHQGDEFGWEEFHRTYRPLIVLRGRDRGLNDAELDELVQEVMLNVFKTGAVARYDAGRARFRDFLRTVIDRRAIEILRRRRGEVALDSLLEQGAQFASADHDELGKKWLEAWQKHVLAQALEELRASVNDRHYAAFALMLNEGLRPKEVAERFGISADAARQIRHRLATRLREAMTALREDG